MRALIKWFIKIFQFRKRLPIDDIPHIKPLDVNSIFRTKHHENHYAKYRIKRNWKNWIAKMSRRMNRGK